MSATSSASSGSRVAARLPRSPIGSGSVRSADQSGPPRPIAGPERVHSKAQPDLHGASMPDAAPPILFTSEAVTEGHPDKLCDAVADAVLDDVIGHDPEA